MCVSEYFVQDINNLKQVWEITQEWNDLWKSWKVGQFVTLQTESMESKAQDMFKKINSLQRQLKVSLGSRRSDIIEQHFIVDMSWYSIIWTVVA